MKMTFHHHQKLNISNISAVSGPILTKPERKVSGIKNNTNNNNNNNNDSSKISSMNDPRPNFNERFPG